MGCIGQKDFALQTVPRSRLVPHVPQVDDRVAPMRAKSAVVGATGVPPPWLTGPRMNSRINTERNTTTTRGRASRTWSVAHDGLGEHDQGVGDEDSSQHTPNGTSAGLGTGHHQCKVGRGADGVNGITRGPGGGADTWERCCDTYLDDYLNI